MTRYALLVLLLTPTAASAQSWTLGPTFSFGYGWMDGQYDHVGDDPIPFRTSCGRPQPTMPESMWNRCIPQRGRVAAYGALGLSLVYTGASRWAWASSLDVSIGGTRRLGDSSNTYSYAYPRRRTRRHPERDQYYEPKVELAYRLSSTGRVRLGAARRGYLGTGLRFGYRMQMSLNEPYKGPDSEDPDIDPEYSPDHFPRGFTLEALLETGVRLGESASLGVVVGAGRPRFRAELALSFPIGIGAR